MADIQAIKERIQSPLMERIRFEVAIKLSRSEFKRQVGEIVGELLEEEHVSLDGQENDDLVETLLEAMPIVRAGGLEGDAPRSVTGGMLKNNV